MDRKVSTFPGSVVAAFDFDKTITTKDSFSDFLFYSFGRSKVIAKLFFRIPVIIILVVLRLLTRDRAKQYVVSLFFKGMSAERFNRLCEMYSKRIPFILSQEAMKRIHWHRERGDEVVIVSASIYNWIYTWAKINGIKHVIATELEVKDSLITGKFSTPNCRGKEKAIRFMEMYPKRTSYRMYAYGDSKKGDRELLEMADFSYYKTFRK